MKLDILSGGSSMVRLINHASWSLLVAFFALGMGVPLAGSVASSATILEIQQRITAGDIEAAQKMLTNALAATPNDGGLYNLRGIIAADGRDYRAAESDFATAIRLSPQLTAAHLNLARIYRLYSGEDNGSVDRAIGVYRHLLKNQPKVLEARQELARLLEQRGSYRESLTQLATLPPSVQTSSDATMLKLADLTALGRLTEGRIEVRRLQKSSDLSDQEVLAVLPVLSKYHRADLTCPLIEELDRRGIASAESLQQLASAYESLNKHTAARQLFERVARENPLTSAPLFGLARVAYKQRDLEGALGYLAHALEIDPDSASGQFFFGIVCIELDLAVEARKSLQRAIELAPDNAYYQYALGGVELQNDQSDEAIKHFENYRAARPTDPHGYLALGVAKYSAKDYEGSRYDFEIASRAKTTAAEAEYYLGKVSRLEGVLAESAEHFSRSLRANPKNADAYAELAWLQIRQAHYEVAAGELAKALELNPNSFVANEYLVALYQKTRDARLESQRQHLNALDEIRSRKQDLMTRIIQFHPF